MYVPQCMYVYHVYAVPVEAKRGHQTTWNWSYSLLWGTGTWTGSLKKQQELLTAEPTLQPKLSVTLCKFKLIKI